MKISDLHYHEVLYDIEEEVSDEIVHLNYPQKYIQLDLDGVLYNLEVMSVDDKRFIVVPTGLVSDSVK